MDMKMQIKMCLFIIWLKKIQFNLDSTKFYWIEFDSIQFNLNSIECELNWI
jgi:hypothetical protein